MIYNKLKKLLVTKILVSQRSCLIKGAFTLFKIPQG